MYSRYMSLVRYMICRFCGLSFQLTWLCLLKNKTLILMKFTICFLFDCSCCWWHIYKFTAKAKVIKIYACVFFQEFHCFNSCI